jgi:hypothetical protein
MGVVDTAVADKVAADKVAADKAASDKVVVMAAHRPMQPAATQADAKVAAPRAAASVGAALPETVTPAVDTPAQEQAHKRPPAMPLRAAMRLRVMQAVRPVRDRHRTAAPRQEEATPASPTKHG